MVALGSIGGSASARCYRGGWLKNSLLGLVALASVLFLNPAWIAAQTGGEGAIEGTVTDSSRATVPGATVTVTNVATSVAKTQSTSSAGVYDVSPLIPGTYTVSVASKGFSTFEQQNVVVNALQVVGLNVTLKVGSQTQTVTVTSAPPELNTTNATLGGTMQTSSYQDLPVMLSVGGASGLQQRDITQVSNLMPGAQVPPGGRSSIIGGTAQRLGELYVDGLPLTTASQQGDNRPVFNIVPFEAIDQVQVVTSGFSAEYEGAGLENYNLASGGNKYHGALFEYNRNTIFDAWSFSSKPGSPSNVQKEVVNGVVTTEPGPKPAERQNEYGFKIGGPIKIPHLFNGHDKLFFFAAYDKFGSYAGVNPSATSVPTTLMRTGDFTELLTANGGPGYTIYDPTTLSCPTPTTCTRQPYMGIKNGTPTVNVIPAGEISPISQYMMQWLPQPQVAGIQNNWLGGIPSGYNNWLYSGRIDYDISANNRLSFTVTGGNRHAVPYTGTTNILPVPYLNDTASTVAGHWADAEDSYTVNPQLVNQLKFGFMNFGGPPVMNLTNTNPMYAGGAAGITGLPTGQASTNFPVSTFGGNGNNPVTWSGGTQGTSVSETYTVVDNLLWVKGKHALTIGFQYQWLESQGDSFDGYSAPLTVAWNSNETANINDAKTTYASNTGYSFASYLIGAVNSSGLTVQPFSVVGGRYHPFAPYVQDDYKVTSKLTLNLGLRWDFIPTFNEAKDRWSFLNPNITNPITGNSGALQFAGNFGGAGVSCNCSSPVDNYFKNWGPRLGFAYSPNGKTVLNGGFGILYSHAGGTGGAGGSYNGTGDNGFTSTVAFPDGAAGPNADPAFWLNTVSASAFAAAAANGGNTYTGGYAPNTNIGGPGYVLPAIAPPSAISQGLLTGFFVCGTATAAYPQCNRVAPGGSGGSGSAISYADPYLGGRAPQFDFWNFGIQRQLTANITISANYAGSQSHFLAGASNIRGLESGELNPIYFPLAAAGPSSTNYLSLPATAANVAAAQAATGIQLPNYPWFQAAAAVNSNATIQHMLTWMPQYPGTNDTWGDVANANYHALQLSLSKRTSHGSSITVNYTYSKNIDDAGTIRSGYPLSPADTLGGRIWQADRIDRALSANDQPQSLTVYGVYALPFGKGGMGANSAVVRGIAGGWKLSGISQYSSGLPLTVTANCSGVQGGSLGQGQCMPDLNPAFTGSPRINGGWGNGVTAATLGSRSYIGGYVSNAVAGDGPNASPCTSSGGPFCNSNDLMIGDAPRIAPFGLRGQGNYRLNLAIRRDFGLTERFHFIFGVDCANVTNHVTFGNNAQNNQIGTNVNSASFGTLSFASSDSRAFQFSGRVEF
jgi:hypothetical protein